MAYEKQNFEDGQLLTAEALNHMEEGIANALPGGAGSHQQLVTDGDGNTGWADRLAYEKTTLTPCDGWVDLTFVGTTGQAGAWFIALGGLYTVVYDGIKYSGIEPEMDDEVYDYGFGDKTFAKYPFYAAGQTVTVSTGGEHTFSVYQESNTIEKIPNKYLSDGTVVVGTTTAEAYKQPATDESGNMVYVDRLAYDAKQNVVIQEGRVAGGPVPGSKPGYGDQYGTLLATSIVVGDTYVVEMDGVQYTGVATEDENEDPAYDYGVSLFGSFDDFSKAPLNLYAYGPGIYVNYENEGRHDLKIMHVVVTPKTIDPKFLPEATAVSDATGETPTATEFNALLASLRTAGYLAE